MRLEVLGATHRLKTSRRMIGRSKGTRKEKNIDQLNCKKVMPVSTCVKEFFGFPEKIKIWINGFY
jgi:hypothetical protein